MSINQNDLNDGQRAVLDKLAEKGYVKAPKYSDDYDLVPSNTYAPEQNALFDRAHPAAEERLNAALEPLVDLPWQEAGRQMLIHDLHVWKGDLTDDQVKLIENAPQGSMETQEMRRSFDLDFDTLYELRSDAHHGNRLRDMVRARVDGGVERDTAILAELPWQFDREGNLTLNASTVEQLDGEYVLPAPEVKPGQQKLITSDKSASKEPGTEIITGKDEVQDILEQRGVKLVDGQYVLGLPNTVSKIYDAPDGDTDRARINFYEGAHDNAMERNRPAMELPWQFDKERWAFTVTDDSLSPKQTEAAEDALIKQGKVYEIHSLEDYGWRAHGPRGQVKELRDQLVSVVPEDAVDVADLGEINWKHNYKGLIAPLDEFMKSDFAKQSGATLRKGDWSGEVQMDLPNGERITLSTIRDRELDRDSKGPVDSEYIAINPDNVKEIPHYAAVKRAMEKRYGEYLAEHADEINALPWVHSIRDDVKTYGAIKLHETDLSSQDSDLVNTLIDMGLLHNQVNEEYWPQSDLLFDLLKPQFEKGVPEAIAKVADMPWEHIPEGIRLAIPPEKVTGEHAEYLERRVFGMNEYAGYTTDATEQRDGYESIGDKALNDMRRAIASKIRERTPVAEITDEIRELPWKYGGGHHGWSIAVEEKELTAEQVQLLKDTMPEIHHMDSMELHSQDLMGSREDRGYFEIETGEYEIAHSIIGKPYYDALKPVADENFNRLVKEVAKMPWRENEQGGFELTKRDLTKEQQHMLDYVPDDLFDHQASWDKTAKYTSNRTHVIDPNADDQRLMTAIRAEKQQRALPAPGS